MTIAYRKASINDANFISELLSDLGYEVDGMVLPQRLDTIRESGGEVLVAESGGQVIGCIHALVDVRLAEGRTGEIVSLVVSADHRGKGIGKELVRHAIAWLEAAGCRTIRVRANVARREAHLFYRRFGFEELKEQKIFVLHLS